MTWKAREFDLPTRFIELAGELNARMPNHVVELVAEALGSRGLEDASILLLGVAYKKNVGDWRESPALRIWEILLQKGARVSYYDPLIPSMQWKGQTLLSSADPPEIRPDCVVLITDHDQLDLESWMSRTGSFVDTRGATRDLMAPADCRVIRLGSTSPRITKQAAGIHSEK